MPYLTNNEGANNHIHEIKLLEHLLSKKQKLQNHPEQIIEEIDLYYSQLPEGKEKLIKVGPTKGTNIRQEVQDCKPKNLFEFGSYIGYSSILFAIELKKIQKSQYNSGIDSEFKIFTFESDPKFYEIAMQIIKLANLSDMIHIIYGEVSTHIEQTCKRFGISQIDLLFIDHWKHHYLPDLRLVESLGLISKGSMIFADNVLCPGCVPEYLEYVQQSPLWKQQYNLSVPNISHSHYIGKFGLIYETEIKKGVNADGEIDGVAVTKCVQTLN